MKIATRFEIGDKVIIDGGKDIVGIILAFTIRGVDDKLNIVYEVVWIHNGDPKGAWIEEWRLESWEE